MGLRTVVLKLYKPGKSKSNILDEAILNYNKAYQFLLKNAFLDLDAIRERFKESKGFNKAGALSKWVSKELSKELNKFNVQPFKDSLKLELAMTLAGYLRLQAITPEASFPKAKDFIYSENTENIQAQNEGLIQYEKLRPLYFCRYDIKRSYSLLYDREKNRYFAKLYLMNFRNGRPATPREIKKVKLKYIFKDNKLLEIEKGKETFIIIPLSFGKYQEEFLKEALQKPGSLKTAKLIKKRDGYYLAVSIDTGTDQSVNTDTFMGVARGLKNKLNYTIVDLKGQILNSGSILQQLANRESNPIPLDELHKATNTISSIALKYKSQVILQNLKEKGDGINWTDGNKIDYQPAYRCRIYIHLTRLLEYKLPEKGLPLPVKVSSVDIFYRCHECGFNSRRNRLTRDIFICTKCGASIEIENLGSYNLARKLIRYSSSKIKVKAVNTAEGIWFTNKLIGLNCFIPHSENQLERLREEIQRLVEDIYNSIKDAKGKEIGEKLSIIKKFSGSEDLINLIKFV